MATPAQFPWLLAWSLFFSSLLRGGRTQPEPQGQSSHVTLPLGSWQGSLLCFCCLHKVQCALQGRKMALGSPSTIGRCQGQRGTGVLSCDGASAVTTSSEVSLPLLQQAPGMSSLLQGDLVSSPIMAESESTPDFRDTRPVLEGGGLSGNQVF